MTIKLLLVDDEVDFIELLAESITRLNSNFDCVCCSSVDEAKKYISTCKIDIIFTDINLKSNQSGFDLMDFVSKNYPEKPVVVISAYGDNKSHIEMLKLGAFDFIPKPLNSERLSALLDSLYSRVYNTPEDNDSEQFKSLIGESDAIIALKAQLKKIAKTQAPVFINGESGVGKEVAAKLIHNLSSRANGNFVAINCGAIPAELIESELFGHKKGSFSGATSDSLGLIRAANKGTLFLDEIADLPMTMQVKLLRVVQEKKVRPVGSDVEFNVDFRILSASHKDLQKLVSDNLFRQDLYYRLNVVDVKIPPLRERGKDIVILSNYFCEKICEKNLLPRKVLSSGVLDWLSLSVFEGNIRELQNIIEKIVTMTDNSEILLEDIYEIFPQKTDSSIDDIKLDDKKSADDFIPYGNLENYLDGIEKTILEKILIETHGNKTEAATKLGISFRSFRHRLKKFAM